MALTCAIPLHTAAASDRRVASKRKKRAPRRAAAANDASTFLFFPALRPKYARRRLTKDENGCIMVVCRRSYRGKSRKGGPQTPLRCAQNAAFCKPFASAAGSRSYRRRKAGAPDGGASASDGANALSAKDGASVYGQPACKSAKRTAFAKGLVGRGGAGTPPSRVCTDRRRTETRRQKRAWPKRPPIGNRFGGTHTPDSGNRRVGRVFPRAAPARASDRKNGRFPPRAACQRRRILQTSARARFCPPSAKGESQRRQSPRRPSRRPEARPPNAHAGEGPRRRASRQPRNPAVTSDLRAGRLFYSNCKGRFSSLFFSILIMLVPNPPRTARRKRQEGRFFLEDHH